MKNIVGTFEAKTNFTKLIEKVRKGEVVMITRRGEPVAKMVPLDKSLDTRAANAAISRIKLLAKQLKLGKYDWEEWKSYRDVGRK
jgi:prevent-host-death family protein